MAKLFSKESTLLFTLDAITGKIIGTIITSYTYIEYIFEPEFSDIFLQEFTITLISGNIYHISLAVIVGTILVVWKNEDIFE